MEQDALERQHFPHTCLAHQEPGHSKHTTSFVSAVHMQVEQNLLVAVKPHAVCHILACACLTALITTER